MNRLHLATALLLLGSAFLLLAARPLAPRSASTATGRPARPSRSRTARRRTSRSIPRPGPLPSTARWASAAPTATPSTRSTRTPSSRPAPRATTRSSHYTSCQQCHEDQFKKQLDGVHLKAIAAGNKNAAVCSDCHNPHAPAEDHGGGRQAAARRAASPSRRPAPAATPRSRSSTGRASTARRSSTATPTCRPASTATASTTSPTRAPPRSAWPRPRMCADCHTDAKKMAKYKLSTAGAADLRGRLPRLDGDALPAPPPRPGDQQAGVLRLPRHPRHREQERPEEEPAGEGEPPRRPARSATPTPRANFPDAWLSHYIPTRERTPLVYWSRARLPDPDSRASWAAWRSSSRATSCGGASTGDAISSAGTGETPYEQRDHLRAPAHLRSASPLPTASSTR